MSHVFGQIESKAGIEANIQSFFKTAPKESFIDYFKKQLSKPNNTKYDLNDRPTNVSSDSKINNTNQPRIEEHTRVCHMNLALPMYFIHKNLLVTLLQILALRKALGICC